MDLFRPSVGFAAVKLLEDSGCSVEAPLRHLAYDTLKIGALTSKRDIANPVHPASSRALRQLSRVKPTLMVTCQWTTLLSAM